MPDMFQLEDVLRGTIAETKRTIDLPGNTKEGMQELLRYICIQTKLI
jgi:hypothetical protein